MNEEAKDYVDSVLYISTKTGVAGTAYLQSTPNSKPICAYCGAFMRMKPNGNDGFIQFCPNHCFGSEKEEEMLKILNSLNQKKDNIQKNIDSTTDELNKYVLKKSIDKVKRLCDKDELEVEQHFKAIKQGLSEVK